MIHLNYKTNKELVKEMLRILPEFEFEARSFYYDYQTLGSSRRIKFKYATDKELADFVFPGNGVLVKEPAVTPSDVIRFLQDERVMLNYRETSDNQYRTSNTATIFELVINRSIFLSSENFQEGVEDVLLPALKKIK